MRLTEKQALMLYEILIDSLSIVNAVAYSREKRLKLANDILEQQDNKNPINLSPSQNEIEA